MREERVESKRGESKRGDMREERVESKRGESKRGERRVEEEKGEMKRIKESRI